MRLILGLSVCAVLGCVLPAAAMASSIAGTVTAAVGHAPIAEVEVCSHAQPYTVEDTCAETDSSGKYLLAGLAPGEYSIHFSDRIKNRNYVDQYYGGSDVYPGTRVTIGGSEERNGIGAELQPGGSILGTVTDAESSLPIPNVPACAMAEIAPGGYAARCAETAADGTYRINGLPPGSYEVEFQSGLLNYQQQYYPGVPKANESTKVTIAAAGDEKGSIDVAMHAGAEISGTVTEVGTGKPLGGITVELVHPSKKATGWPGPTPPASTSSAACRKTKT